MMQRKTILVAPLNWGLGHATRCIPIINELIIHGFKVIVAGDGAALLLLQKEFPKLEHIELPSYNITYPRKGNKFRWNLLLKVPHILKTIAAEKRRVSKIVEEYNIKGIISDNRWGVISKKVPSVFVTHQLHVLSGSTTSITSKLHQNIIRKFTECWIPDFKGPRNLSGKLGHINDLDFPVKYIGTLSRLRQEEITKNYDILILLSGPEPQRTMLEKRLLAEFKDDARNILLVRGVVENEETVSYFGNIKIINYLKTDALSQAINESELVVARSGYTTIMDLAALEKKCFFIPTPGQYEQKYLAKRLKEKGIVASCKQRSFTKKKLLSVTLYSGLSKEKHTQDYGKLFSLFHSK
ncbi:glycosyl transferase [Patiriisocius marinistellae]|uniref:Glycosyl transferase n=1 Tax=Patiriisocius marinistellae TaxID=2494560 RepID=A0A5J4FWZ3_9FLAO|nr:glycosyltransferase [Patiriisocius marinistellae]GEQ84565.1 glycosyl transferase [Patiriisocius marinistellae]